MKIFSTPSILLLTVIFGIGASVVAASLTISSLRDYSAAVSALGPIDLSGERLRAEPSGLGQAVETAREKTLPATAEIFTSPSDAAGIYELGAGQGRGFFITSDGWLVAAPYNFSASEAGRAAVFFNQKVYSVEKAVASSSLPIVFLKINAVNLPVVSFGNALAVEAGDILFVAASANELLTTSLFRSVYNSSLSAAVESVGRHFELAASLDSSLAGAAVANSFGEVIGMLIADKTNETNIVLPFTAIKPLIYSLLKEGKIVPLWFGATTIDLSRAIGYDETVTRGYSKGALLGTITKGGPAESAGLLRGDIVLSVSGLEISEKQSLGELLSDYRVGDTVNLGVDRGGTILKIGVTLGSIE